MASIVSLNAVKYLTIHTSAGQDALEAAKEVAGNKLDLLGVSKFKSSKSEKEVFLSQYLEGMHKKQTQIFYLASESLDQATKSPHLEAFKSKGLEVLFLVLGFSFRALIIVMLLLLLNLR